MSAPKNRAELIARVDSWAEDDAVDAAECIALAESEARDLLHIGRSEVSATLNIVAGSATLPADLGELVTIAVQTTPITVPRYVEPPEFDEVRARHGATGPQRIYTIRDGTILFSPVGADGPAAITYRRDLPALTVAAPTNWLIDRYPHAYLHGALKYAFLFGIEDARAAQFDGLFQGALASIRDADARRRTGPRPRMAFRPLA